MPIQIEIYNESSLARLPRKRIAEAIYRACKGERIEDATIRLIALNDDDIHKLNKRYLQHDYPTDVITFTMEKSPLEGEVYIGTGVARQQAGEYGVSLSNELMRLAVHGVLHLAGYEDETLEMRTRMNHLETLYINSSSQI